MPEIARPEISIGNGLLMILNTLTGTSAMLILPVRPPQPAIIDMTNNDGIWDVPPSKELN